MKAIIFTTTGEEFCSNCVCYSHKYVKTKLSIDCRPALFIQGYIN